MLLKKNCTDTRNSKIFNLAQYLKSSKIKIDIYDPWVDYSELRKQYKFNFIKKINKKYEVIILAVSHDIFKRFTLSKLKKITKIKKVIFDVKSFLDRKIISERL